MWPRRCITCGELTWRNPAPVAVVVIPIEDGVLAIRRGVPPRRGELALPGGFIDYGESWEVAAAREVREECGLAISGLRLARVLSPPDGEFMLVFGVADRIAPAALDAWVPNEETLELVVVRAPIELAFPLHTQILAEYFGGSLP